MCVTSLLRYKSIRLKMQRKSLDNTLPVTYADISEAYWTYRRDEK